MKIKFYVLMSFLIVLSACKKNEQIAVADEHENPIAKKVPKELIANDDKRIDNYFWMRLSDAQKNAQTPDAQTQDVLNYLEAENSYLKTMMSGTEQLQDTLYKEMVGRIKKDDQSVPVTDNGYSYYTRYEEGMDYPLYCRKKTGSDNEEILLNGPELADGYTYYGIGGRSVSPDNNLMVFGIDTISRREYVLYIKNLETGTLLTDKLSNTSGSAIWANDNKTLFYAQQDPQTLRDNKIYKHVLGTDQSQDVLVFEEKDETFNTYVYKTKSNAYIIIGSSQTLSSEFQFLDANTPNGKFKIIQPREKNLEYSVDHYANDFYIRTNLDAHNFKLVKTPVNDTAKENWVDVIPHREDVYLQDFELFKNHLVTSERKNGLSEIRVMTWDKSQDYYLDFQDPSYRTYTTNNLDFNTNILRYVYTSLTTPSTTYEYNMDSKSQKLLKQEEVVGGTFDGKNYVSNRLFATATDGTQIPISLVYKKGVEKNGKNPLLLYAYGSYGINQEAAFSSNILSLLDRGFVYAIAHIRGGQEMGRDWYENGKLLKKKNTFTDFIDCGKFLINERFTSKEHLYGMGGSAGGLLIGAVINMEPDLFNGVVAAVPFVDVVSTMLDETIPLTTFEFDEWGNPKEKVYYDYMKSYSPYDNVEAKDYPNMLVTTGYWDSQVQYWEPAKWVAKLREMKTDDNLLLMDVNMDTGHGGASGRFERYKRTALTYAFFINLDRKNLK
ncbi:oligopeptidase B [Gelidibacter algens]|uniref:Proline-specific endopeptidase n=1 Tax=Gelidibacter algens TaxID=49280 RepID=A0A1A7R6Z4_9FLAO|nr:S9 family peptidase [Gelidibacter algens]OBX26517.1 oligopeptidase B [Gelidibacter algens]RAJ26658.1 oligopeptidase B [Gelidibacter algens]